MGYIAGILFFIVTNKIFSDYTMHENGWINFISTFVLIVISCGVIDFVDKRMKKKTPN